MDYKLEAYRQKSQLSLPAVESQALGKLGNLVARTLYFSSMFPCLSILENIFAESKFASLKAKTVSKQNVEHFPVKTYVFYSLPTSFNMRNVVFPIRHHFTTFFHVPEFLGVCKIPCNHLKLCINDRITVC